MGNGNLQWHLPHSGSSDPTDSRSNSNLDVSVFVEGGKPESPEKNTRSKDENEQQTRPKYDAGSGNRTRATLVGGKRCHHCAIPAPRPPRDLGWGLMGILRPPHSNRSLETRQEHETRSSHKLITIHIVKCQLYSWANITKYFVRGFHESGYIQVYSHTPAT